MATKSLFTLAILAVAMPPLHADDPEKKAIEFIQKLDGTAGSINRHGIKQPWTDSVGLEYRKITDEGLKELAPLRGLSDLHIGNTSISDAGLKELAPFKNLLYLGLDRTRITADTRVTDAGLRELADFKSVKTIVIADTKVTDAGVKQSKKMWPGVKVVR